MDEQQSSIARMSAVTISREYGSGGGEVANLLVQRLGWRLLDHEAVVRAAQHLGVSAEEVEAHDERVESLGTRILTSFRGGQPRMVTSLSTPHGARVYHEVLHRVVEDAAHEGHVVIMGRGGQMLLARRRDVLHVRIVAPLEQRILYVMRREGLTRDAARVRIQDKDQARRRYLQSHYRQQPSNPLLYDLVINTGILSLEHAATLIYLALAQKAERLMLSEEELGPAAHLVRYPGRPADFQPPTEGAK